MGGELREGRAEFLIASGYTPPGLGASPFPTICTDLTSFHHKSPNFTFNGAEENVLVPEYSNQVRCTP